MRLLACLIVVCALGFGALYHLTVGYTALTSEQARRNDVAQHPRQLSDVMVTTPGASHTSLLELMQQDGRYLLVNFIYTRCITLCLAMGAEMQQIQDAIIAAGQEDKIALLSISFDPSDTPDRLQRYMHLMKAKPGVWNFVTMDDGDQRAQVLEDFGIIVIPAPYDEYEHNAAYHVVDAKSGQLLRITDYGEPGKALSALREIQAKASSQDLP